MTSAPSASLAIASQQAETDRTRIKDEAWISTAFRASAVRPNSAASITSRTGGLLGDEGTHLPQPLPLEFPFR